MPEPNELQGYLQEKEMTDEKLRSEDADGSCKMFKSDLREETGC